MEIEERIQQLEALVNLSKQKYQEGIAKANKLLAKVQKNPTSNTELSAKINTKKEN